MHDCMKIRQAGELGGAAPYDYLLSSYLQLCLLTQSQHAFFSVQIMLFLLGITVLVYLTPSTMCSPYRMRLLIEETSVVQLSP